MPAGVDHEVRAAAAGVQVVMPPGDPTRVVAARTRGPSVPKVAAKGRRCGVRSPSAVLEEIKLVRVLLIVRSVCAVSRRTGRCQNVILPYLKTSTSLISRVP